MTVKLADLTPEERAELAKSVAAELRASQTDAPAADLSALFDLEGLSEEAKNQRKAELQAQLVAIRKQAELEYRAEMARLAQENRMTELAEKLTGGNDEAPRGLRIASEELRAHLLKLDADEAKFWGGLLERTQKDGFIEFAELGHGKQRSGTKPLPAEYAEKLDSGDLKIADLAKLGDPALAVLSEFDLSKWDK